MTGRDQARHRDARYDGASDRQVAETILADINFRNLPWENAVRVVEGHVRRLRTPVASAEDSRPHRDPYCLSHCSQGLKHSQCGCDCDHAPARWCRLCQQLGDHHTWACPSPVQPGDEGYEDAFDICPEPTCPLCGKAVMADHRHLGAVTTYAPDAPQDPECDNGDYGSQS